MGTEVECESYSRVLYSMRDLNEDPSNRSWPHYYGETSTPVLQFNNGCTQRNVDGGFLELEKDALKQKMLEHEAVFKNQVYELHRLYWIQRNMMDEVRRKEVHIFPPPVEPALSSCLQGKQLQMEAVKWKPASIPLLNSANGRTSGLNIDSMNSPASCSREDSAVLNMRHSKAKRTFDLQHPADDYIDIEEDKPESGTKKFLVDLNEPIPTEGAIASSVKLDLTSENTEIKGLSHPSKVQAAPGFPENTHLTNKLFNSSKLYNRGQFSHSYAAGVSRSMIGPPAQSNQSDIFPFTPHLHHGGANQVHLCPVVHPSSSRNGRSTTVASHMPSSFQFISFPGPQAPSIPSIISGVKTPVLESVPQNQEWLTRKGLMNCSPWLSPDLRGESAVSNGFCNGLASNSKGSWLDMKSSRWNIHSGGRFSNAASNRCSRNILKVPCQQDGQSASMAIDLNKEIQKSPSDEVVILEDLNASVPKVQTESHMSPLPWFKSNATNVTEAASPCKLWCMNEADEYAETKSVNKTLRFSLSKTQAHENEPPLVPSTSLSNGCRRRSRMIDINMACDLDEDASAVDAIVDKKKQTMGASIRCNIDLNASVSDCEDQKAPFDSGRCSMIEEHEVGALRNAAELVLAMSMLHPPVPVTEDSYCLASECLLEEALFVLADAVSGAEIEDGATTDKLIKEMDEFEATVLQLEETKEEEYMPKSVACEFENAEETDAIACTNRSRRVQTRRGRQRRDFQRDTLPGLASLSRHEITEDVQIFSGLMKATGHRWSPGLARRNGGRNNLGRGRKRAVIETAPYPPPPPPPPPTVNPVSTLLIQQLGSEDKSLTGWGKTTRRPRRQRLAQVNPSTVMLS